MTGYEGDYALFGSVEQEGAGKAVQVTITTDNRDLRGSTNEDDTTKIREVNA